MSQVRVAVVQLTCHPSFTVGGRDFASEPFLEGSEPILSRLARSMDVSPIRALCASEYGKFHDLRVASALEWIAKKWNLFEQPIAQPETNEARDAQSQRDLPRSPLHIIAFPEGSIPHHQVQRLILPFVKKAWKDHQKFVTVLAGTHAFHDSDAFLKQYPQDLNFKHRNPFSDSRKAESATPIESRSPDDRVRDRREELNRLMSDEGYDAKSVLPIVHYDGSVSLRLKEMSSPFERTNTAQKSRSQRTRLDRDERKPKIFHSLDARTALHNNNLSPLKPDFSILPLVCSEALQLPDTTEEAKIIAILSYHAKPRDFRPIIDQARNNGKLVLLVNDGAYGGSGVFLSPDMRAENWWFGQGNEGALPQGDGAILVDVDMDKITPQLGQHNPHYPSGLVAISAIVPNVTRSPVSRISDTLTAVGDEVKSPQQGDREPIGIDYASMLRRILPLVESSRATPIQRVKLWRLRELLQLENLTRAEAESCCDDIRIGCPPNGFVFLEKDTVLPATIEEEYSLTELESRLSWDVLQFIEHATSLANEKGMGHEASDLVDLKRLLERRRGSTSASDPLTNIFRTLSRMRQEAIDTAKSRLAKRLGKIVERFRATSGWLFIVTGKRNHRFFPVAAYNAPELHIDRPVSLNGSGIVGHVAENRIPYLANNVHDEIHQLLYIPDVPTTKSEMTVPLLWNGMSLGVMNIEANYENAFTPIDVFDSSNESKRLIADLLVISATLDSEHSSQWHPVRHGWQLTPYLDSICGAIAQALPTLHGSPSIGCSVWCLDATKETISVIGTARFDFEYVAERVMDVTESHIGQAIISMLSRDKVTRDQIVPKGSRLAKEVDDCEKEVSFYEASTLVADLPGFKRKRKARRMELRTITVFPFVVSAYRSGVPPMACALVLYGFDHEWGVHGVSLSQMFTPTAGHNMVAEVSEAISQFYRQKSSGAIAYLNGRLHTDPTASRNPIETVKQVLQRVFSAHGCTLFVRQNPSSDSSGDLERNVLLVAATTGVTASSPGGAPDGQSYPLLPLDSSKSSMRRALSREGSTDLVYYIGLTNYLGQTPRATIRKNDAVDIEEPVRTCCADGEAMYFAPKNSLLESFAPGASEHMRFLGVSVSDGGGNVSGVVRLTRTGTAPPFLELDEFVLQDICSFCVAAFRDRADHFTVDFNAFSQTAAVPMGSTFSELVQEIAKRYGVPYQESLGRALFTFMHFLSDVGSLPKNDPLVRKVFLSSMETLGSFQQLETSPSQLSRTVGTYRRFLDSLCGMMKSWCQASSYDNAAVLQRRFLSFPTSECLGGATVNSVLEDVNSLAHSMLKIGDNPADNPTVLSSLRCVVEHYPDDISTSKELYLRVVAVQPAWNSLKPDEDLRNAAPRPKHQDAIGWRAIDRKCSLSYWIKNGAPPMEIFHWVHPLSGAVKSGICFPFEVTFGPTRIGDGELVSLSQSPLQFVLSVDFACDREILADEFVAKFMPHLQLASEKIAAILSRNESKNDLKSISERHGRLGVRFDAREDRENFEAIDIQYWQSKECSP